MSEMWFYLDAGQPIGPVSLDQLQAAVASGLLGPERLVRQGTQGNWQAVGQVAALAGPPTPLGEHAGPPKPPPTRLRPLPPPPPCAVERGDTSEAIPGVVPPLVVPPVCREATVTEDAEDDDPAATPLVKPLLAAVVVMLMLGIVGLLVRARSRAMSEVPVLGVAAQPAPNDILEMPAPAIPAPAEAAPPVETVPVVMKVEPGVVQPRREGQTAIASPEKSDSALGSLQGKRAELSASVEARKTFEAGSLPIPESKIDVLVFAQLTKKGLKPAPPCADAVFCRRVYLDVIGTLPTPRDVRNFLQDRASNKRAMLIDRLLARREFADYWALKWSDLLRVKAEFPINLWPYAAQVYHRWIRTCIRENMPYDRFARELLTASGSNFRVPQVNFYRAVQSKEPQAIAQTVALTFLGARADKWPPTRLAGMAAFFARIRYKETSEWKEEIVLWDPKAKPYAPGGKVARAVLPDGTPARLEPEQDPREVFADWLITPQNPWFSRQIANRVWYWFMGRGIVHEPDDFRDDNPPQNPELLSYLASELVAAHFDLRHLFRLILNSKTYQLSSIAHSQPAESAANFGHYPIRRLEAEVLVDAICQITGTTEKYLSYIPEPFTFVPEDHRTISLSDGSITSSFLEMFGRPPRDTGMELERNNRVTAAQRLHLLNSTHIRRKLEQIPALPAIVNTRAQPEKVAEELYLLILSRLPSPEERSVVEEYFRSRGGQAVLDVAWALINSAEFLHRH